MHPIVQNGHLTFQQKAGEVKFFKQGRLCNYRRLSLPPLRIVYPHRIRVHIVIIVVIVVVTHSCDVLTRRWPRRRRRRRRPAPPWRTWRGSPLLPRPCHPPRPPCA